MEPVTEASSPDRVAHDEWRRQRVSAATAPTGKLSLVETRWFPSGTSEAEAAALTEAERASAVGRVTVSTLDRENATTGEPEFGLRVWDADAPAIGAFEGIDTFPFDPAWVVEGEFRPAASGQVVAFEHIRDAGSTRDHAIPGEVVFTREGQTFTLAALDNGDTLLVVFGDPTNGMGGEDGTYGPGRFLFLPLDESGETGVARPIRIDFNRAAVPPCGFSAQFNCPLPPVQNRLPWPVRAGEKNVRFRAGFDMYSA